MSIKKFISNVLDELQDLKSNANKKRYVVEELEFELGFVASKSASIGNADTIWDIIIPVTAEGTYSSDKIQKVKIKLKPKSDDHLEGKEKN